MHQRLGTGPQARADKDAVGAQHQRGCETPPIGDAAGGGQQRVGAAPGEEIGNLRHQGHRRASGAVTAGLCALGDDDVGPCVQRHLRVVHVLHLADQQPACRFDDRGERMRIAE